MSLIYGVITITSLALLGVCLIVNNEKEHWLRLLFVSVFVADSGYFLLSVSKTPDFVLLSGRIAYAGNVFLPFFMFMALLNFCGVHARKRLPAVLSAVGTAVLLLMVSPGLLTVYYIYLFSYFAAMVTVIIHSIKKKKITDHIHGILLLVIVSVNIIVWLAEQFLPHRFEFLSIAYMVSEALLLVLYSVFQKYNMKRRIICVWTLVFTGVGIAIACKFVSPGNPEYYFCSLIRSFIYMGMYYAWGRMVCHGIIQRTTRRCFGGVSFLLVFWLAVSSVKHLVFYDDVTIVRYLWYAYYIPQILLAVLGLNIAVMAGRGESVRLGKGGMALFGIGAALILLVLTNDLHQLVFSFPEGVLWTNESCTHEMGYYLIMVLVALCCIAILMVMVHKYRIPRWKKFMPLTFLSVIFMIIYWVLYFVEGSFVHRYLNDMTAAGCLMVAALAELVIESGLFHTNTGYEDLFQSTTITVQLADREHQVCYTSEGARTVPKEILVQADMAPVILEQSVRLSGAAIHGGHIYWQENVAELLSVQKDLEMTREELCDTGDILKAETEQKAYRLHLEEENRLYNLVEAQTASQVAMLRELTTQLRQTEDLYEAKCLLGKIVIVGTYIKRRSDLILVSRQKQSIRKEELILGFREFTENLRHYGVECAVQILNCERFLTGTAGVVYDVFEAVVEEGIDTISAILLCLEVQGSCLLFTICADCREDLTILTETFPEITVRQDEDGLWYLNRVFNEGGCPAMSYFAACGNLQQTALIMLMMGTALLQMFIVIEDVTGQRYLFTVSDSILLIVELFYAETLFEVREATAGMGGFAVDVVFLWLLEAGLLVYAAVRYIRMRMRMRYSLSRESIKEGSDNLPDGICFFDEYGAVRLINKKMMAIGIMLFGKEIQTLDEMRSALRDSQSGVECLDRETALYHFPDGTVYRFTESVITDREGKQITEVIAADVTELYAKRKELNCENIRLMDANRRMKEILDNMDDIVREEEILSMKIRVHDDIGHSILAAKKSLIQHQDIAVIRENVVLWETAVDLLYRANNMPAAQDEWQTVKNRAEELGVKIVFEGTLPEEETVRYLLLLAIRECVTNCVRHAGGDRVFVGISDDGKQLACAITNNGRAPQRAVVEGSGLSGLRRRIEREGGTMELEGKPCFVLTITLPLGKFYKESEDSYEKCDDCGRPEDDTKYFGRVY